MILSSIQTRPLLEAHKRGQITAETSLDLGITTVSVTLNAQGVQLPSGETVGWADVEKISKSEVNCYTVDEQGIQAIQVYSEQTERLCSLLPTQGAPSMLVAGFVMHRIKEIDPWQHAQRMIAALAPIRGHVLDTTTGLGYTTILAARSAEAVTTLELDPGAQEMARLNPWSQELFTKIGRAHV